jgi:RNA polymerase sigma-70 factor, ECF subfamily
MNTAALKEARSFKTNWVPTTFSREYLSRLRDGDAETQSHFAIYFGSLLSSKVRNRVRSPQLAEEIRQETLLRVLVLVRRDGIHYPECLGSLVNSVCNRVVLEVFRREGKAFPRPEKCPDPVDERPGPESDFLAGQRSLQVRRILDGLPAKDREVLRLVFLEERGRDEVCRTLNVAPKYIRVLLYRARAKFRAALEEDK